MKKVLVEISARHVHLSAKDLVALFGRGYKLKKLKDLSEPGEFAAKEILTAIGQKGKFKIRIVGPLRTKTQLELSVTDCRVLGVKPVFRVSGDSRGTAAGLVLKGPKGSLKLKQGVMVPIRHLHISAKNGRVWGLRNRQIIKAIIKGTERPLVFDNIVVRFGNFRTSLHLDTDEANAAGLLSSARADLVI